MFLNIDMAVAIPPPPLRVYCLGRRVQGVGRREQGVECRVYGGGCRVWGVLGYISHKKSPPPRTLQ